MPATCPPFLRPGAHVWLLGLAWLLVGLVALLIAAVPAHAKSASCNDPDPRDVRQVYQCMMSVRFSERSPGSAFEQMGVSSCSIAASQYKDALRRSGYRREEIAALTPSCAVLGQALAQVRGKPPAWTQCTEYPGQFEPAHMKTCLDTFLPGHYGGRGKRLAGCADAIDEYEKALRAGMQADEREPGSRLPVGYERPSCDAVALAGIVTVQTPSAGMTRDVPTTQLPAPPVSQSPCGNYEPGPAHIQRCLGVQAARYTSCIELRRAYEGQLRQAYGGGFPPGYMPATCDEAKPITDDAQAKKIEQRDRAAEQRRQAAIQKRQELDSLPKTWGEFFSGIIDFRALYGHLGLAWLFFLFAWRKIKSGAWVPLVRALGNIFTPEVKLLHYGAQAGLFYFGAFQWGGGWNWMYGAMAAIPAGLTLAYVMMFLGFFDRATPGGPGVGNIDPPPRSQTPPPRQPGGGEDRGDTW